MDSLIYLEDGVAEEERGREREREQVRDSPTFDPPPERTQEPDHASARWKPEPRILSASVACVVGAQTAGRTITALAGT